MYWIAQVFDHSDQSKIRLLHACGNTERYPESVKQKSCYNLLLIELLEYDDYAANNENKQMQLLLQ